MAKKAQAAKAKKVSTPHGPGKSREQGGSAVPKATQASLAPTMTPVDSKQSAKPRKSGAAAGAGKKPKMSGLDAAATILAEAGKPLNCKELIEKVFAKGLWTTSGKTPAATIHAAMIREIRDKGAKSRFRKHGRGTFVTTGKTAK